MVFYSSYESRYEARSQLFANIRSALHSFMIEIINLTSWQYVLFVPES